jgi:hypothetical protein
MGDRPRGISRLAWPVAIVAGLLGFGIFFSDSGAQGDGPTRLIAGAVLGAVAALAAALLRPAHWLALGLTAAWGSLVAGSMGLAMGQDGAGLILTVPLAGALCGALVGRWIGRSRFRLS